MEVAIGIGATVVLALIGVVWSLLNEKIRTFKEECEERDSRIWDQIGRDSDSGMRKAVHNSVPMGAHMELERRVHELERE